MKLTIDLSLTEEGNIRGWVNKGLTDPVFAAHPWRIVLEERTQARFDQVAAQFGATPGPTPPPGDPFADLKWRQATFGSWAAFQPQFLTPDESNGLKAAHPELAQTLDLLAAYYGPGGWGNITGQRLNNVFYFNNFKTGVMERDSNGAADKFILGNSVSAEHPNGVPPPSLTIP
jgi:hypothetical protein